MKLTALLLVSACAYGQWLKYPTPDIPRLADGKVNLKAPAPKTAYGKPDLSGIWSINGIGYAANIASDLKSGEVMPWADLVYKQRLGDLDRDSPDIHCLPPGPRIGLFGELHKIIQTPQLVAILYETGVFRQVLMDGRPLPKDPNPTWQGYSVGHWEGDTLVVETAGFNDKSWLDAAGHPHTEALRVTERFRRPDFGHMKLEVIFDDPKAYTRPWTIKVDMNLTTDTELLETVCNENERDSHHLIGKTADEPKEVRVPREILAKYVGDYKVVEGIPFEIGVTLKDDQLIVALNGTGKLPLVTQSETRFFLPVGGAPVEFFTDEHGVVTHLVLSIVEGDLKAVRRK